MNVSPGFRCFIWVRSAKKAGGSPALLPAWLRGRRRGLTRGWSRPRTDVESSPTSRCLFAQFSNSFGWRERGRSSCTFISPREVPSSREGLIVLLAKPLRVHALAHLHGSSFPAFATARPRLVRLVLRRAAVVVCLTHETRAIVKSLVDADAPVLLIHNALESSPPSRASTAAPSDAGVVVFAGKVGWRKGVDVLLEAWQELDARSELDGARLIICGPLDSDFSRRSDDGLTVVGDVAWSRCPR